MKSDAYVAPQPLRLFITRGAGAGKAHPVNSIRLFLKKKFTSLIISEQQKIKKI